MPRNDLRIPPEKDGFVSLYQGSSRIPRSHSHEELEFNLLLKGSVHYLVAGKRVVLQSGTLLWLFPDQEHHLTWSSADCELWVAVFKPRLLHFACRSAEYQILLKEDPEQLFYGNLDMNRFGELDQACRKTYESTGDLLNAGLHHLLLNAWQAFQLSSDSISYELHPAIYQLALLIRDEPENNNLSELCREAGMSQSHLSRLFHKQMGETLSSYRSRQRLEYFKRLYGQGQRRTLEEAAALAGFGSYSQFYRTCVNLLGMTPRDYNRQLQADENLNAS